MLETTPTGPYSAAKFHIATDMRDHSADRRDNDTASGVAFAPTGATIASSKQAAGLLFVGSWSTDAPTVATIAPAVAAIARRGRHTHRQRVLCAEHAAGRRDNSVNGRPTRRSPFWRPPFYLLVT